MTATIAARAGPAEIELRRAPPGGRRLSAAWPLTVVIVGLPLWWLLGLWQLMFFIMAVPMAVHLMRQRTIEAPRGFGLWLLFIAWLLSGLLVLQVDAPGAEPGASANRYITFSFRVGWYVVSAIVALYALNTRRLISTSRLAGAVAWLFVIVVALGSLGLLIPEVKFSSALQLALPGSIANHPFVHSLIHVQFAQLHSFLGDPQPRPSAPFAVTNEWGLVTALTLPFFVAAWWRRSRPWRIGMFAVLAVAAVAVVSSLNRGVWGAIGTIVLFLIIRELFRGRARAALLLLTATTAAGAILLTATPLGDLIAARFENQHSNERRGSLGELAIESTATGSPVVGFGTTRYVAGNFSSIAGGATAACPSCGPPPLGTQGQLWLVMFGAGFVGMALFIAFLLHQFISNLGTRSAYGVAALCSLIVLMVTMPVYNSVGVALYIGLLGVGILARESQYPPTTLQALVRPVTRHFPTFVLLIALGGAVGWGVHQHLGIPESATQRVLVPEADLTGIPGTRSPTMDSEALLVTSDDVVGTVAHNLGMSSDEVRSALTIGAEPNTRILRLTFTHRDQDAARDGVTAIVEAYLGKREALIDEAGYSISQRYQTHQSNLDDIYRNTYAAAGSNSVGTAIWQTLDRLRRDSGEVAGTLLDVADNEAGRVVSAVSLVRSNDATLTRVASGLALGGLLAVPLLRMVDRRFLCVGARAAKRLDLGIPVVAVLESDDLPAAERTTRSYLPMVGVVPDPHQRAARRLGARLDGVLAGAADHAGSRTLLIVTPSSKVGDVRELHERCVRSGIQPVGLIVCQTGGESRHTIRRRVARHDW